MFAVRNSVHLQHFVVSSREQEFTVVRNIKGLDCSSMSLNYLRVTLYRVVPESDGGIVGTGCNDVACWVDFNIVYLVFMTDKPEGSHGRLEVPDHNGVVSGAGHYLFQIWVERNFDHLVFVTFKGSFEGWISSGLADLGF